MFERCATVMPASSSSLPVCMETHWNLCTRILSAVRKSRGNFNALGMTCLGCSSVPRLTCLEEHSRFWTTSPNGCVLRRHLSTLGMEWGSISSLTGLKCSTNCTARSILNSWLARRRTTRCPLLCHSRYYNHQMLPPSGSSERSLAEPAKGEHRVLAGSGIERTVALWKDRSSISRPAW